MHKLNLPFDATTPDEVVAFIQKHIVPLSPEEQSCINIKANDLLAEIGVEGLRHLHARIMSETGITFNWMIDGKWFDIPNTVAHYVERLTGLPVAYYTVHASGGTEMIRAAKKAAPDIKLLAITVLTSMKPEEVTDIYDANRSESLLRLAKSALDAGADGLVCSAIDAPMFRAVFGNEFLLVTPNIQREGIARNDDQNSTLTSTPANAIKNGVSDIVVGRPIFQAEKPSEVIREMLAEMNSVGVPLMDSSVAQKFDTERLLQTGNWEHILSHIGAMYRKPEGGKYVRLTSGFISDLYFNMGTSEVDYRVLDRACHELSHQILGAGIIPTTILGAQMGSVRLSLALGRAMGVHESVYTEKDNNAMALKRHDFGPEGFRGKKVILSEDVIAKGSTIAKMVEIVKNGGGEVVAITCIINRTGGKNSIAGVPLFYCYISPEFGLWWDEKTLEKTRANELAAGKTLEQAEESVKNIQTNNPPLPEGAEISEKPKNEWSALVESMRI